MYPILKDDVDMFIEEYEDTGKQRYVIANDTGEYAISRRLFEALLEADGTKPLKLPDKGKKAIPWLKKRGFIQTSRFNRMIGPVNSFILTPLSGKTQKFKKICRVLNKCLPLISVIVFMIGLCAMLSSDTWRYSSVIDALYYGLIGVSILLHECGHLIAGVAYGYDFKAMGLLFFFIFPLGAYVECSDIEETMQSTRKQKIQFSLAGVEVNLLLAGIGFLLSLIDSPLSRTLMLVGVVNVALVILNILPALGLDGEKALSALCGVSSICITAVTWVFSKEWRKKLFGYGFAGCVGFVFFLVIVLLTIAFWLIVGYELVYMIYSLFSLVFSWFGK